MPRVCLALQGGGAHGAFTWGVLDRLLEDGRFAPATISGTSAGALNAAALATGLPEGPDGARRKLEALWQEVSNRSPLGAAENRLPFFPFSRSMVHDAIERMKLFGQLMSPYSFGLPSENALRPVVEAVIDFPLLQSDRVVPTFVSATDVESGNVRVFSGQELTADALLASACLPDVFRAVEIEGRAYWDGGYVGNPMLTPFFAEDHDACDILIVQVTPFHRAGSPETPGDIMNRVQEITFNTSLIRDLRMLTEVQRLVKGSDLENPVLQRIAGLRLHMIEAGEAMARRSSAGKMDTRWSELTDLRDFGRAAASAWLAENGEHVGHRSTLKGDFSILT
ncbi:patatin-like phospholipase family protein [Aureimonas ureilytica]|uniref:patatin-like phospholipase family protein n=1 Tax=Aureimonas ureilytica TaxID=401562 RepID=UPI000478098C|nr:patatin-like phospholipase family protein [Aureimonas ureilytica]